MLVLNKVITLSEMRRSTPAEKDRQIASLLSSRLCNDGSCNVIVQRDQILVLGLALTMVLHYLGLRDEAPIHILLMKARDP